MTKTKERIAYELALALPDNTTSHNKISWEDEGGEHITMYHDNQFRWDFTRERACEPEDSKLADADADGYVYIFLEEWDEFDRCGLDGAIEILKTKTKNIELLEPLLV